ncbi:GGDEF domain-containing protein [Desulfuromonas thiophila]|uniref:GGDEF domain-containing protein n=1 Tax=Desulfuromonas thiophila TaxID=57664 RepID=UPI0029F55388|nr:GGDEF domain-containing protein [Desulfuromonas thiophila]
MSGLDDQTFHKTVHFERVKLLYQAAASNGLRSSFLVILFIPLFLWPYVDHALLLVWTAVVVWINCLRVLLWKEFQRRLAKQLITPDNALTWERYFVLGISMTGLPWAATIFFPFQQQPLACMIYVLLMHTGTNAAVSAMYMASKATTISYLVVTLMPTLMRIAWEGAWQHMVISLLGVVFIAIMGRCIRIHSRNLIETIELKIKNEELSKRDYLTGLWNRRHLNEFTSNLLPANTTEIHRPFCVMLSDIDFFKKYNDTHGHNAGDELLSTIARLIRQNIRSEDLAVRYGGEEFLIVFVGLKLNEAVAIAERIRQVIKQETSVTISAGLVEHEWGIDFKDLTQQADKLLYQAKSSGRDQVVVDV